MTSSSALGYTQVTLQFDLSRAIDGAVSDTLSAINAATAYLPTNMPYPPLIRKVNPADTPIPALAQFTRRWAEGACQCHRPGRVIIRFKRSCRISATRVQSKAAAHRSDGDTIAIGTLQQRRLYEMLNFDFIRDDADFRPPRH
jgi:hypothetical protein